jgi:hypothetical protein
MRPWARTLMASAGISVVVVSAGLALTGLPAPAKNLPTGLGGRAVSGRSVLTYKASAWAQEYSTTVKPTITRHPNSVEVSYVGHVKDTGLHRKVEVFQGVYHGVAAGQHWVFSIRLRGLVVKTYAIVGMEWFNSHGKWVGEKDVYPPVGRTYQRALVAETLPPGAKYLAVYVQLPEINSQTRLDVTATSAILVRMRDK